MLSDADVPALLEAYDLGSSGSLSPTAVAHGLHGAVWRLDTSAGPWAVKVATSPQADAHNPAGLSLQDAAQLAGMPVPAVRRTGSGADVAHLGGRDLRVHRWVDMNSADIDLPLVAVGTLLAGLHRVGSALAGSSAPWGSTGASGSVHLLGPRVVDPWYTDPVGADAWDALLDDVGRAEAPFAPALVALRDELVGAEATFTAPEELIVCHRDLFADNVRSSPGGGLVVFDFDNAGWADPSMELAFVLAEFATAPPGVPPRADRARARELLDAYEMAGGVGRLRTPGDFTLVAAVLGHLTEQWARTWLASTSVEIRAQAAAGVAELTERPLTRAVVAGLLEA